MDLYEQRGYDQTTVVEIAERAGLTERTFFRHYADKREVLFGGSTDLGELLGREVAGAPGSSPLLDAASAGLVAVGALIEERRGRDYARRRQAILAQNPELQERELIKMAAWAGAIAGALRSRGAADFGARLAAEAAVAAFRVAFEQWVGDNSPLDLPSLIRQSFDALEDLTRAKRPAAIAGARVS
jgi:AcrR family transcriptional regulator